MANIDNIKIGSNNSNLVLFNSYYTSPNDYRFNFTEFEVNSDASFDGDIYYDKIVIRKFKPNVWLIKSPKYTSVSALCNDTKNLSIGIKGLSANSELFGRYYAHHSVVGGSGNTIGYIRGVGVFPFAENITGWQLTTYGSYAQNRGELPYSAYIWDSLTYTDGSTAQVASELTALRGDWGAGYAGFGKAYDSVEKLVLPDYSTFPTPYGATCITLGLYTGKAISFDAWECSNKVNSLKMVISQRNVEGEGSTKSAFCYSNFGTITIRVSGLSSTDRLEYGNSIMEASSNSITSDGEYSITYKEGYGFILYGDTTNTSGITIELINNAFLDSFGYVDVSDNPITISLINTKGIDFSSVECWDMFVGNSQVYHKDKTLENCLKNYHLTIPSGWGIHRNTLGTISGIEWLTPFKFKVKKTFSEGESLAYTYTNTASYWSVSYRAFKIKIVNKPEDVEVKVERIFTNITTEEDIIYVLGNGITSIPAYSKTLYASDASTAMIFTEAKITIVSETDLDTNFTIEIIPEYPDGTKTIVNTGMWSNISPKIFVPTITDITNEVMENTKWQIKANNSELWESIKNWYSNNTGTNSNFYSGNIFSGSDLDEITIRMSNSIFHFGEDNFANSEIKTITFVQEGENAHFSAPQRLLRSASKLETINIEWANPDAEDNYLCGANTIVDGMSGLTMETYPERFINWYHNRSGVISETANCTLFQYCFNWSSGLVTIPSYPGTDEENTIFPARNMTNSFYQCSSLTTVGPTLNMALVVPGSSSGVFSNCVSLSSIKIKNLNHGNWNFDGVTRDGINHGTLEALDSDSIVYLFSNLSDLTTHDSTKHEDTIDKSFKNWTSAYKTAADSTPDWDYTLSSITVFSCRKRYTDIESADFIATTDSELTEMAVRVSGLQDGDSVVFVSEDGETVNTWLSDQTLYVTKEAGTIMGFKLLGYNTDSSNIVTITIVNGLDYTNPRVSSANLYCPSEWDNYITGSMITEANDKGWGIYVGGTLKEASSEAYVTFVADSEDTTGTIATLVLFSTPVTVEDYNNYISENTSTAFFHSSVTLNSTVTYKNSIYVNDWENPGSQVEIDISETSPDALIQYVTISAIAVPTTDSEADYAALTFNVGHGSSTICTIPAEYFNK